MRLTYEELTLPGDETMGLLGGSYMLGIRGPWQFGFGAYGAARGQRGGFFTGGLALGMRQHIGGDVFLGAGLFAGGGGGGSAPQGGGLMVRPHAELAWDFGGGTIGVGYSRVDFPNGDIVSDQVAVSFSHGIGFLAQGGWSEVGPVDVARAIPRIHHRSQTQGLRAELFRVQPDNATFDTTGLIQDRDMWLMGASWWRDLGPSGFFEFGAAGSMGGSTDGFAQVTAAFGSKMVLMSQFEAAVFGGVGLAGGGRVDTGGGVIGDVGFRLQRVIVDGFHLGAGYGVTAALDGEFSARRWTLALGHHYQTPVPTGGWRIPGSTFYEPRRIRIRFAHQSEIVADGAVRKGGAPDQGIALSGIKGDIMVSDHVYFSAQALAAYDGGAGGYAMGLAGGGAEWSLGRRSPLAFGIESLIGAAGGGGIDVAGGLITQSTAGLGYRFEGPFGAWIRYGWNGPIDDAFARQVIAIDLTFRFTALSR